MNADLGLVSVVVATNRSSPYLAEALDSVVTQTYPSWELVIVDNGVPDPDALADLVAGVSRAKVVHVPPPVTVSLARNAGVEASVGDLVVFLDDDDVWHPRRLERQVSLLKDDRSAPASYCGGWHMDAAGRPFDPAWPAEPARADEMLAGRARMPHICGAMLIRREAFAEVGGFSPELSMMEDFELALRLLSRGTFACAPDELVGYRRHDGNATSTAIDNVRLRREAVDGILARHAWAADARGDSRTAQLLREHRSRERARAAHDAGLATLAALRRGRFAEAGREAAWGVTGAAGAYFGAIVGRLARKGTSRHR
ncbi:glycosyltransferase family 2 protein [Microbacterium sulfonylureivorans]|uniref:glycosyltransferase family 2 protein n=1 Tax=Microbacterium sulfonylureivorans TaxID=2486854 RepID=UPI0013E03E32|nr:glycosyltransferase [Microbacterium sulfonylureivorans]